MKFMNWLSNPKNNTPIFWTAYSVCLIGIVAMCILIATPDLSKEQFANSLGDIILFMELVPMIIMSVVNMVNEPVKIVKTDKRVTKNSKI